MNENHVIDWLKDYFNKPGLKEKELKPVLHFSLLWNLFEHTYFTDEKRLNPKTLINLSDISFQSIKDGELNYLFDYFKERYLSENKESLNRHFNDLNLDTKNGHPNNFEFCSNILINTDSTKKKN